MNEPPMTEGQLLQKVRTLLEETTHTALDIYNGTGVPPNQQYNYRSGKVKDPSVNTIEALYVFLSGKPLEL